MQMMTDSNCVHRVAADACAPAPTVLATLIFHPDVVRFSRPVFSRHQPAGRDLADDGRQLGRLD